MTSLSARVWNIIVLILLSLPHAGVCSLFGSHPKAVQAIAEELE